MAEQRIMLKVFVAAPGDVQDERNCIEGVVKEMNKTISGHFGLHLDLVSWETDVYPAVGDDAQGVINEQIGDDFDILVGIMWTRFGTPTGRAGSGTEEEFERAFERHQQDPNQLRIMWYFKDGLLVPSKIDSEQLGRVSEFREKLKDNGVLFKTFSDREDFEQMLRLNLSQVMSDYGRTWGNVLNVTHEPTVVPEVPETTSESPVDDADEGFLDVVEAGLKHWATFAESMERMGAAVIKLRVISEEKTEQLQSTKFEHGNNDISRRKQLINEVADALEEFADKTGADLPVFSTSFSEGLGAASKSVGLMKDFGTDNRDSIVSMLDSLNTLDQVIYNNIGSIRSFRETLAQWPRITTRVIHAKKRAITILDMLIHEHQTAHNLAVEAKLTFQSILDGLSDGEDS